MNLIESYKSRELVFKKYAVESMDTTVTTVEDFGGEPLGKIVWHDNWCKYVFYPQHDSSLLDDDRMYDIIFEMGQLNNEVN